MSTELASLRWVALFMASMNRALGGDIYGWELKPQADPLSWVLHIVFLKKVLKEEASLLREQLRFWAEVNDAKYQRSWRKGYEIKALILIRGLGPLQNTNPYEGEEMDLATLLRRGRGRLRRARRKLKPPPLEFKHEPDFPPLHTADDFCDDD